MSSPADYYNGLPPITRAFATACFATTVGVQFGLVRSRESTCLLYNDFNLSCEPREESLTNIFGQVNPRSIFLNWLLVGKHFQASRAAEQLW